MDGSAPLVQTLFRQDSWLSIRKTQVAHDALRERRPAGKPKRDRSDFTRLCWVGNSMVAYNQLASMLAAMLKQDSILLHQQDVLMGGQSLGGHSRNNNVRELLGVGKQWDYVVLQDNSSVPGGADAKLYEDTLSALSTFFAGRLPSSDPGSPNPGKVLLFGTWAHKNGSCPDRRDRHGECYPTFLAMHEKTTRGYLEYKAALEEAVRLPLGLKWQEVGPETPIHGTIIDNDAFAAALLDKHEFQQEELSKFKLPRLSRSSCIKVGSQYFAPDSTANIDVSIVPVGEAFRRVYAACERSGLDPQHPDSLFARLYAPDAYHPSRLGTFLAACVFYGVISGRSPRNLHFEARGAKPGAHLPQDRIEGYLVSKVFQDTAFDEYMKKKIGDNQWVPEVMTPELVRPLVAFAHATLYPEDAEPNIPLPPPIAAKSIEELINPHHRPGRDKSIVLGTASQQSSLTNTDHEKGTLLAKPRAASKPVAAIQRAAAKITMIKALGKGGGAGDFAARDSLDPGSLAGESLPPRMSQSPKPETEADIDAFSG